MYKIKAYEQMRMKVNNNTKPNNKNDDQTKTKLSPQGPQWSRHSVARQMRRRGDRPPHSMDVCIWKIWGDKEFVVS
jgi:hypothetical protein